VVSYINVGRFDSCPQPTDWSTDAGRKIVIAQPLYPAADVLALVARGVVANRLFTTDCATDVARMEWNLRDVLELVQEAIEDGTYKGSEWCKHGSKGPIAACDAYSVRRRVKIEFAFKTIKYYVKFAISKSGTLLLIFSCHD
jgi:hypothetical protein